MTGTPDEYRNVRPFVETATDGTEKDGRAMNRITASTMKRNTMRRLFLAGCSISLVMQLVMASPVVAATTLPVLWTGGGLSAGTDSAGQAGRIATDHLGNVAVVSGPSAGRDLAVTSYTATGSFRWQASVSPSVGTFRGDWVAAAPNGDFVAVGTNVGSSGSPLGITLVRYASDGRLQWRLDLSRTRPFVARLLVDNGGNAYLAFSSVGDGQDIQLHKYNASGVLLWSQVISTGFFANDIATSLAFGPDETDVVLIGDISGGAEWITAAYDAATGTRRWLVTAAEGIAARDVVLDATRVYVTGQGNVGISGFLTVVAYDRATGARLWRTDKRAADSQNAAGLRIARAPDGSLVATGQTLRGFLDWYTVAFETTGAVRWEAVRDGGLNTDEVPAAVLVRMDGTTVVTGPGGPNLPGGFIPGVAAGYGTDGSLLWEAFSRLATVWATSLPGGDVCATGGYDAMITCWQVPGVVTSNEPPTAIVSATPSTGAAPLAVAFGSAGSSDPDGSIAAYSWNFGDGGSSTASNPSHTYANAGAWTATLTVTDNKGATGSASVTITVTPAIARTLRSTDITLSGKRNGRRVSVSGQVTVRDDTNTSVSGVNVSVSWRKPDGTSVAQSALTNTSGVASFNTSGGRGTYTLTVTNLARSGYTFDAARSLLTRSITK
jgi:hypothetical protein